MTTLLNPGVEELVVNSPAAIPADGTASSGYAVPQGMTNLAVSIRPVGTYTSLSVAVQIANNNVDAEFADAYTSTAIAGEFVVVPFYAGRFVRVKINSSAGAARTGIVIGISGK